MRYDGPSIREGDREVHVSAGLRELWAGFRAQLPILIGVAPFGAIYGALAVGAGLSPAAAQGMSALVFAGSSQFIATSLFATLVVNLRHAWYSASVAPLLAHLPRRWKLLIAYLLTDEAYVVAIQRYAGPAPDPDLRHYFFAGSGLAIWVSWQISTAVGVFVGAQVPPEWNLDFALPLTFIALLATSIADRPAAAAAVVAGLVALLAAGLPYQLGLVAAAAAGISAGAITRRLGRRPAEVAP
jgi:predicted branched-subunit amino acid permease